MSNARRSLSTWRALQAGKEKLEGGVGHEMMMMLAGAEE